MHTPGGADRVCRIEALRENDLHALLDSNALLLYVNFLGRGSLRLTSDIFSHPLPSWDLFSGKQDFRHTRWLAINLIRGSQVCGQGH